MATRKYWLVKQEPEEYAWSDLLRDGKVTWDGVRNYQARNNLRAMQAGDRVLFYHSVGPREVVGIATVAQEAFPDPTDDTGRWSSVELRPAESLKTPVGLDRIKQDPELAEIALIRQSRLSVMPLSKNEYERIVSLGT